MAFVPATPVTLTRSPTLRSSHRRSEQPCPARSTLRRHAARMVATGAEKASEKASEKATATPLSSKAKELLSYIRGHKSIFTPGVGFNSTQCTLFRKNDTGRCLTPLDELATNAHELPAGSVAALMVVQEEALVEAAVAAALDAASGVAEDATVREVVQFDMRCMIRVISYGAACQSVNFIHRNNLGIMKMLHEEVGLPSVADVKGLETARDMVLAEVTDPAIVESTAACFDVVIKFMS